LIIFLIGDTTCVLLSSLRVVGLGGSEQRCQLLEYHISLEKCLNFNFISMHICSAKSSKADVETTNLMSHEPLAVTPVVLGVENQPSFYYLLLGPILEEKKEWSLFF